MTWLGRLFSRKSANPFIVTTATTGTPGYHAPLSIGVNAQAAAQNSVVQSCLNWSMNNGSSAPLVLQKFDGLRWHNVQDKFVSPLLADPMPGKMWTLERFLGAVFFSLGMDGNAYAKKVRLRPGGPVVGLQWLLHSSVSPVGRANAANVIEYYDVWGVSEQVPAEEMVHITTGVDPNNLLKGISPLKSIMRHVLADNQIAAYAHSILLSPNPSLLISPDSPDDTFSTQAITSLQLALRRDSGGEKYGGAAIVPNKVAVEKVGFSPADLTLDKLTHLPEERICSVFGLSPVMLGLGSGLEHATYSNFEHALRSAAQHHLVPRWRAIEAALTAQLLPDFGMDGQYRIAFDLSVVELLQESADAVHARARELFKAGIIDRAAALAMVGMTATDGDRCVYFYRADSA